MKRGKTSTTIMIDEVDGSKEKIYVEMLPVSRRYMEFKDSYKKKTKMLRARKITSFIFLVL